MKNLIESSSLAAPVSAPCLRSQLGLRPALRRRLASGGALPVRRRLLQAGWKPVTVSLILLGLTALAGQQQAHAGENFSWAGSYAGVEVGPSQTVTDVKSGGAKKAIDRMDAAFGLFAGHNWQFDRVVVGVEANAAYLGGEAKGTHPTLGDVKTRAAWTGAVKGRVGMAFGRVLPYLSAGVAVSDHEIKANGGKASAAGIGLVLGAGAEYAATDRVHLRADYSLTGVMDTKDRLGGASVSRVSGNHRLMLGLSYAF